MAVVSSAPVAADGDRLPVVYIDIDAHELAEATGATGWEEEVRGARTDRVLDAARDFLGDGVTLARTCAERFASGLRELPRGVPAPDEIELGLRISFDSELGAVLAKAKAGAQLEVKMRWRRDATTPAPAADDGDGEDGDEDGDEGAAP